jgi:hypothetical protein
MLALGRRSRRVAARCCAWYGTGSGRPERRHSKMKSPLLFPVTPADEMRRMDDVSVMEQSARHRVNRQNAQLVRASTLEEFEASYGEGGADLLSRSLARPLNRLSDIVGKVLMLPCCAARVAASCAGHACELWRV